MKEYSGVVGNECADKLAVRGVKLRHDLMINSQIRGLFRNMVER